MCSFMYQKESYFITYETISNFGMAIQIKQAIFCSCAFMTDICN